MEDNRKYLSDGFVTGESLNAFWEAESNCAKHIDPKKQGQETQLKNTKFHKFAFKDGVFWLDDLQLHRVLNYSIEQDHKYAVLTLKIDIGN